MLLFENKYTLMDVHMYDLLRLAKALDEKGLYKQADRISLADNGEIKQTFVKERAMPGGYIIRTEMWEHFSSDKPTEMVSAYTPNGDYIGDPKTAKFLVVEKGIMPQKNKEDHCVCSIGYCADKKSWCGWSHRAIHCFKPGDTIKKGDVVAEEHPKLIGKKIETLEEAKKMAELFAEAVS
jgi:hypothetical protein